MSIPPVTLAYAAVRLCRCTDEEWGETCVHVFCRGVMTVFCVWEAFYKCQA